MKHNYKKVPKLDRTNEEMLIQLKNCLQDLSLDALAYDNGKFQAIRRASASLRILFYDSGNSHSILNQIYDKNKFHLLNDFVIPPKWHTYFGDVLFVELPGTILNPGDIYTTFLPSYDIATKKVPLISFEDWWNGTIFTTNTQKNSGTSLTRRELILTMANQDGGAHVDPRVEENYMYLARGDTGWGVDLSKFHNPEFYSKMHPDNNGFIYPKDIHLSIMRIIVHEVLMSLPKQLSLTVDYKPDFSTNLSHRLNRFTFNIGLKEP